jgi:hypothetical protein
MSEHLTQQQILLAHGSGSVRLWRNNVGTGWAGQATKVTPGNLRKPSPLRSGLVMWSSAKAGRCTLVSASAHPT